MAAKYQYKKLVDCCSQLLCEYRPDIDDIEEYLQNFHESQHGLDLAEEMFAIEIVSGCARDAEVLRVIVRGFYNSDGAFALNADAYMYTVFTYLALFRLSEIGVPKFCKFVKAQDVNKMYKFLHYFLNESHLTSWMKDQWNTIYDTKYVDSTLVWPILRHLPQLDELLDKMKRIIDNNVERPNMACPPTEPKPFDLTKSKPRLIPMPEPIETRIKQKPVPETTYKPPKERRHLAQIRVNNKKKAQELLNEKSFSCASAEKSKKTKDRMQKIIDVENNKLQFEQYKSRPVPPSVLSEAVPIKLNAATILREANLYEKREEQVLNQLERLESGEHSDLQFKEWQTKMQQQDMERQMADIERRHLSGKISQEEAILARQNLIKENKMLVVQLKEQAQALMREYMEKRMQEEAAVRKLVEDVMDTHENAREAKRRMQEYKASIVREMNEESKEMMRQALEEAEIEMKQKIELIRQIRQMQMGGGKQPKFVNLTETAGYNLLCEMSIAELRERLQLVRIEKQQQEQVKRDEILQTKQEREHMLVETLEMINRHRSEQSAAAAHRFEQKKKQHTERTTRSSDDAVVELVRKLEEKKAQRIQEQEKTKLADEKALAQYMKHVHAVKKKADDDRFCGRDKSRSPTSLQSATLRTKPSAKITAKSNVALLA